MRVQGAIALEIDRQRHPALTAARERSRAMLTHLRAALADAPAACAPFVTVAACGSVGRLEVGADADLDTVFVAAAGAEADAVRDGMRYLFAQAERLGLRVPKADGIFVAPVTRDALLADSAYGSLAETPTVFGKRFALLLDAQPLGSAAALASLQRAILTWYLRPVPGDRPGEAWDYLVADLLRYANAYRNWQVAKAGDSALDSRTLRRAKLVTTRYITWLGLWLLVLRAAAGGGAEWLSARLADPPLARVVAVLGEIDTSRAGEVLDCYERIAAIFQRPEARAALLGHMPSSPAAPVGQVYEALCAAADDFRASVTAGVLAGFAGGAPWRIRMALPF